MVMGQQYKTTVKKGKGKQIYFVPKQELALKNAVTGTVDLVLKEKKNVLIEEIRIQNRAGRGTNVMVINLDDEITETEFQ